MAAIGGSEADLHILEEAATPTLPTFTTKKELQAHYISTAKQNHEDHVAQDVPIRASCEEIGTNFGVGVGMYFEVISWFKWVFLVFSIFAIPYWVTVNASIFTNALHKHDYIFGVKVYDPMEIFSLTFAAIVDSSMDNNTLTYMSTDIASIWVGPMRKSTFLIWIACIDAFGMLLFLVFIIYATTRYRRFVSSVEKRTVEAANFTVLVQDLPADTGAAEIGAFFSRFGDVMDVVVIKQMDLVLGACAQASKLEQRHRTLQEHLAIDNEAKVQEKCDRAMHKLEKTMGRIEKKMEKCNFPLRTAFVTFNTCAEQQACLANCPQGWFSKLFQRKNDRFRATTRFWVEQASSPDDYIYENISCSRLSRFLRIVFARLVVLGILLLCAACVTKLSNISTQESRVISWNTQGFTSQLTLATTAIGALQPPGVKPDLLFNDSAILAAGGGGGGATLAAGGGGGGATLAAAGGGGDAPPSTGGGGGGATLAAGGVGGGAATLTATPGVLSASAEGGDMGSMAYCAAVLSGTCTDYYSTMFNKSLSMQYGRQIQWGDMMSGLINQRPLLRAMEECAGNTNETCALVSSCYPCLCSGLSHQSDTKDDDPIWIRDTRATCGLYIDTYNFRSWGVRIAIALVIATLNQALKLVLEWLLLIECHWTLSSQEMTYSVIAYVAQLLNSVVVLLLVNATDLTEDAISGRGAIVVGGDNGRPAWLSSFILNGSYNDFTRAWYENVGLPILILLMINILQPVGALLADVAWKWVQRFWVARCMDSPGQDQYNDAFARPSFDLQNRVADAMLNLTIAMVFASGMPLCYPIAMVIFLVKGLVERYTLTRVCRTSSRYGTELCGLIIGLLPWIALGHCLLGLWMHTFFQVVYDDVVKGGVQLSNNLLSTTWAHISDTSIGARVTQANGLPLLLSAIVFACWLLTTYIIWPLTGPLLNKLSALFPGWCCPCRDSNIGSESPTAMLTYAHAVTGRPRLLTGVPTYRLPNHPRYAHACMGQLYKAIMARAVGSCRFTRIVAEPGGTFHVASCIYVDADVMELEDVVQRMPTSALSDVVRRMATSMFQKSVSSTRWSSRSSSRRLTGGSEAEMRAAAIREVSRALDARDGIGAPAGPQPGGGPSPAPGLGTEASAGLQARGGPSPAPAFGHGPWPVPSAPPLELVSEHGRVEERDRRSGGLSSVDGQGDARIDIR